MSMDFYTDEYDVMQWDDIKVIVPHEAAVFEESLQAAGMNLDEFCREMEDEYWDVEADEREAVDDAWDKLYQAFTAATTVKGAGLKVEPHYHDNDWEKPVAFFSLEGVYQLTPAGVKYKAKIGRCQFTRVG